MEPPKKRGQRKHESADPFAGRSRRLVAPGQPSLRTRPPYVASANNAGAYLHFGAEVGIVAAVITQ